ncbi:hypothetical protein [Chrysiogenes arsenatis]|uniref:hypothetical protein n=1 Tax=Chrysiogenes arsenatis TaxID=309797 RepID=UPI00040865A1|nr:hypothetical protein [Chrysiogenes arsenatis]
MFTKRAFFLIFMIVFSGASFASDVLYTKVNIHTQFAVDRSGERAFKASYANYTDPGSGHHVFPAGTAITVKSHSRKHIDIYTQEENSYIQFEYHEPRMGMKAQEYLALITSTTPVNYNHLSAIDQQGIREGKAFIGMSKEGVMAALGYPAAHKTPRLESKAWIYWTNRFKTLVLTFDDNDILMNIRR